VTPATDRPPLARSRDAAIGGVCGGVARHLGATLVGTRLSFVVLALCGGAGVLLYLWLWALVPMASGDLPVRRRVPVAGILFALAAVTSLGVVTALLSSPEAVVTPALLAVSAFALAAVAWNLAFDRSDPSRGIRYGAVVRFGSAGAMLLAAIAKLYAYPGRLAAVLCVIMIVLGIGIVVARQVVRLWTELLAERATRVRQEQRAEIAAHLHDSVLQTLALIQNRAGASSEVARIARAQERELRDWLFTGDDPTAVDLAAELRRDAASIELDFAVRFDVVTAGESVGNYSSALVAAAREAMLNAARHAGGDVSVYVETSPTAVDIFVRDRGPGVDLDALPSDRLGIRESIIGRMTRAGGSATVTPGVGDSGTEVHLHLEASFDKGRQ
jgi:signal transduction histidine kinase